MNTALATIETKAPETVLLEQADALQVHTNAMDRRLIISAGSSAILELPSDEQRDRLAAVFKFAFLDMGIKAKPTQYDVERFINYIETNHPKLTTADVKGAFEMFLAGRFTDQLPTGHDHYQQFSVAFYARILRCYVQEQRRARHEVRGRVQRTQLQLAAPDMPKELTDFRSLHIVRGQVATFLDHGLRRVQMVGFTHDLLVRLEICAPVDPPTQTEQVDALRRMKENKGVAVAFTWKMQRLLAGEPVNDVEWEALCFKRTEAMYRDLKAAGYRAIDRIDLEIKRVKRRAKDAGVELTIEAAA